MTTTILARDLKAGDTIDFGGQPATVVRLDPLPGDPDAFIVRLTGLWRQGRRATGGLSIAADLPLNVQRPDPDAELVEVMARAAFVNDGCQESRWPSAVMCETYRENIRAALTAAREAGLL